MTVASFGRYDEAERTVERLTDAGFPVERLAIVGSDLRLVERVIGRFDALLAAGQGAASGAIGGAVIGLVFGLFDLAGSMAAGVGLVFWGLLAGAAAGAVMGLAARAATAGRRDFASTRSFEAGRFDLVADREVAGAAASLLGTRVRAA